MYVIVGLGNPEEKYLRTLHNLGFMVIDKIAELNKVDLKKEKFNSNIGMMELNGEKILLAKPLTYMNNSGLAVEQIVNFYKIPTSNLIVIYDDLDIEIGKIRIREKGSAGTHNGMKSIVSCLGGVEDFPRIRIGTKPKEEYEDIIEYVLSNIKSEDKETFEKVICQAAKAALLMAEGKELSIVANEILR